MRIIDDVHCEWHEKRWQIDFVLEFEDGHEELLASVSPKDRPGFGTPPKDGVYGSSDYADWRAKGLELALKAGYETRRSFGKRTKTTRR